MPLRDDFAEHLVRVIGRVRWLAGNWNGLDNCLDAIPEAGTTQNSVCAFLYRLADKSRHSESFVGGGGVHALREDRLEPHTLRARRLSSLGDLLRG